MNPNTLSKKDLGCILYCHYIDNYMKDDFSFDNGKLRKEITSHYEKLKEKFSEEELNEIKGKIKCFSKEGTDYDSYEFKFDDVPNFFLQVTSMFDYHGNCCSNKYKGQSQWCDVGMFFVNYADCNFEDL